MQNRTTRGTNGRRLFLAGATIAGMLAFAPGLAAQAPGRDSARAEQGMRRGPRGDRQRAMNPEQRIERHVAHLTQRLALTEQQATQVRRILTQEHEQMAAVMEQAGLRRPDTADAERRRPARPSEAERSAMREKMQVVRTQMEAIRTQTSERVEAVLTAEQRAVYRELREQRPNPRGPYRPMRGGR